MSYNELKSGAGTDTTFQVSLPSDIDLAPQLNGNYNTEADFTSRILSLVCERDELSRDLSNKLPSRFKESFLSQQFIASYVLQVDFENQHLSDDTLSPLLNYCSTKIYLTAKFFPQKWKEGKILLFIGPEKYSGSIDMDSLDELVTLGDNEYYPNIGYDEVEMLRYKPYRGVPTKHVAIFSPILSLYKTTPLNQEIIDYRRQYPNRLSLEEAIELIDKRYGNIRQRDIRG